MRLLLRVQTDRLIAYGIVYDGDNGGYSVDSNNSRHSEVHKACRIRFCYMYHLKYLKELFGFVGWKMFGMTCVVLRQQGTPILINLHFGPLLNAAYSIAFRLSNQATSISTAMMGAFQPALTTAEGKGERQKMLSMSMQACKFSTLLVLLFVVPLILEMDTLLMLWLKDSPEYAGDLCQWMLAMLVVDKMTSGSMLAVNAFGKIAAYELIQGSFFLLALPLMWFFFKIGLGPVSIDIRFSSQRFYIAWEG